MVFPSVRVLTDDGAPLGHIPGRDQLPFGRVVFRYMANNHLRCGSRDRSIMVGSVPKSTADISRSDTASAGIEYPPNLHHIANTDLHPRWSKGCHTRDVPCYVTLTPRLLAVPARAIG